MRLSRISGAARLPLLVAHLLVGLWRVRFRLPAMSEAERQMTVRRWSRRLLALLGVRVHLQGEAPVAGGYVLAANHVSWVDIFALLAHRPLTFVAKSEIRAWPVIGPLAAGVGTLFIERGRSRHARTTNARIAALIEAGGVIALFPEGTTTAGDRLLPFHAALFQPVIEAGGLVQPVALRYTDASGEPSAVAAYVDDMTLLGSIWRILRARTIDVQLQFLVPMATAGLARREVSLASEQAIASALNVPPPHRERRTGPDLPDASP
jgi:1-acyl-sn-glycerol-3-phosphate acyltransferase